jgi:membrane fusion protein
MSRQLSTQTVMRQRSIQRAFVRKARSGGRWPTLRCAELRTFSLVNAPSPLFRPAAVAANRRDALGPIVLARPVSFGILTGVGLLIAALLGALLAFGAYSARSTLRGRLVPDRGVIDVHSPQLGTIVDKRIAEGQHVERGEVLFVVSSERLTKALGPAQSAVGERLTGRRRSLEAQIDDTHALERLERASLDESRSSLKAESATLERSIAAQRERVRMAEEAAERYRRIRAQGFVSEELLLTKQADLLEQRGRLQGLERETSGVARQLDDVMARAESLELRYRNQIAELERSVTAADLDIAENEARREILVVAPANGVVTGIAAVVGQLVDNSSPLAFIVPAGSRLRAELYAPSRAVGFISVGEDVLLRYEPFPYQKFGHYHGTVEAVSQTAILPGVRAADAVGAEPVYQVVVALESQDVVAYGAPRELRAGMAVDADVLLETRRLYEWALEPLYSLRGKLH